MSNRKLLAVLTADLHLHEFESFNTKGSRLKWAIKAAKTIGNVAIKADVPLLIAGDIFHTPKNISNRVHGRVHNLFAYFESKGLPVYAISGNHDMSEKNTLKHKAPSHLNALSKFKNFRLLSYNDSYIQGKLGLMGLPYYDSESDLITQIKKSSKKITDADINILMLHGNAPGSVTPTGFEIESRLDYKLLEAWDLVVFGHIHKPQRLHTNAYMLGSPIHQDRGDEGTEMGYWLLFQDKKSFNFVFVPLNDFPKFRTLPMGKKEETIDYISYDVVNDVVNDVDNDVAFTTDKSRKTLAKAYCKAIGEKDKQKITALIKTLQHD